MDAGLEVRVFLAFTLGALMGVAVTVATLAILALIAGAVSL
jgi:hypothetical protein